MRSSLSLALAVLAVACLPRSAKSASLQADQLHGFKPPVIETVRDSVPPYGPSFAADAELAHIGPISVSALDIVCRVAPCHPIMTVTVNGQPVGFRGGQVTPWLVLDQSGNRIVRGGEVEFGRLWRDNVTYTLLIERVEAPASMPHTVEIVNRTGQLWRGVHVTAAAQDHWGLDLASSTIKTGESFSTPLTGDGCLYDIRLRLDDPGDEQLLMGVDLCATPKLRVERGTGQRIKRAE